MSGGPIAVDLFAGAGGLSLGLCRAGWFVPLAVEIERDFAETFRCNHTDARVIERDIADVDFAHACREAGVGRGPNLVCGGPPCQGFSTVGSKRFSDPRNSLFGQFLRAVDEVEPELVLFENVAGFRTMYDGRVHDLLTSELQRRGYAVNSWLIDPVLYGLPQFRKRTIVIGSGLSSPVQIPANTHGESNLIEKLRPLVTVNDAISDLPPISPASSADRYLCAPQNEFQRSMRDDCKQLTEHNCANYGDRMREILRSVPPGGSVNDLPERLRPKGYFANTYARLWGDRPATTVTRNFGTPSSSRCIHPTQHRALSTREGARLQSFPDSYRFVGSKGSKNLQIGNAVPPLLGEVLGKVLLDAIRTPSKTKRSRQAVSL